MASRKTIRKSNHTSESLIVSGFLKRANDEAEKKESDLIRVKERPSEFTDEFIDLWVKVRRLKRSANSNLVLQW